MIVGDVRFHERCHYELFQKRKDRSFILVSHDANAIKAYCENAVVLHQGRLYPFPSVDAAQAFYMDTLAEKPEVIEQWRM
jgi:capsular polysaccharide transport system ATP-binding protein